MGRFDLLLSRPIPLLSSGHTINSREGRKTVLGGRWSKLELHKPSQ